MKRRIRALIFILSLVCLIFTNTTIIVSAEELDPEDAPGGGLGISYILINGQNIGASQISGSGRITICFTNGFKDNKGGSQDSAYANIRLDGVSSGGYSVSYATTASSSDPGYNHSLRQTWYIDFYDLPEGNYSIVVGSGLHANNGSGLGTDMVYGFSVTGSGQMQEEPKNEEPAVESNETNKTEDRTEKVNQDDTDDEVISNRPTRRPQSTSKSESITEDIKDNTKETTKEESRSSDNSYINNKPENKTNVSDTLVSQKSSNENESRSIYMGDETNKIEETEKISVIPESDVSEIALVAVKLSDDTDTKKDEYNESQDAKKGGMLPIAIIVLAVSVFLGMMYSFIKFGIRLRMKR